MAKPCGAKGELYGGGESLLAATFVANKAADHSRAQFGRQRSSAFRERDSAGWDNAGRSE